MPLAPEVEERYWLHFLLLDRPVLTCPVTPTDIELIVDENAVVLTLARCPRLYGRNLALRFLHANMPYLLDAVHQLQVLGGAGVVWRRITCAQGQAPHWRQVHGLLSFNDDLVGRPFDWPDKYLPYPDPVYELPPGTPETVAACLTSLVST